jgi:hypothetical protein
MSYDRAAFGREALLELSDLQQRIRKQLGIEIEPNMSAYLRQLAQTADAPARVPLIGADARTGVPVRMLAPLEMFTGVQP